LEAIVKKNPTLARIQAVVESMSDREFDNVCAHLGMTNANHTAVASTLFVRGLNRVGTVDERELRDKFVGVCG
jgi:hypothetical protein